MIPPAPVSITPLQRAPDHAWRVPGSKSITNRALILAALSAEPCELSGVLASDDTRHLRSALTAMGVAIDAVGPERWRVVGGRARLHAPAEAIFVGNSGTTVRFLAALAALVDGPVTLVGDEHMAKRPIAPLVAALRELGVGVDCPTGCPPLTVHGRGQLPGGTIRLPGDLSSQYLSALLMAATAAEAPLTIDIVGELVSRPYVGITTGMILGFGGQVDDHHDRFAVTPARLACAEWRVEPDASAASYPLAAAVATRGRIAVPGLSLDAIQGDIAFTAILRRLGVRVAATAAGIEADARGFAAGADVAGAGGTATAIAVDEDMHHISDTVMTLAAIAPLLPGPTTIRNVANIRIKETDRLAATVAELRRLGQAVEHGDDWLRIEPRPLRAATVECYADHRMAMSFAILGLAVAGVRIADPACVAKTYPGFWDDLAALYRSVDQEPGW